MNPLIKLAFKKFEIVTPLTEVEKAQEKKPQSVKFSYYTPVSYNMKELRKKLRESVSPIVRGETKHVEVSLERWPQVATAMGELKNMFRPLILTGAFTSDDEENKLFRIDSARLK